MMNYHAERLGLWDDYVSSLQLMLPYMAGAGHRPYTKTLARWLDEIGKLDADTLEFFQKGFFVVRRTERAFSGVSLDLNIEQTLMATMKGNGGLTHGRTFTDLNSMIWLASRPVTSQLDQCLRKCTSATYHSPEQCITPDVRSKSEGIGRKKKDQADMDILEDFFTTRGVFTRDEGREKRIMNIATGYVAPETTNIDRIRSIGERVVEEMYESDNLKAFKIKKKDLAVQIPKSHSTVSRADITDRPIAKVDPQVYLQRCITVVESDKSGENVV